MPAMSANIFIPPGRVNVDELSGKCSRTFCLLISRLSRKLYNVQPNHDVLSEFRIYSDFSLHPPLSIPGTRRDNLNPPLTSGESHSESGVIFDRCHPDQGAQHLSERVES